MSQFDRPDRATAVTADLLDRFRRHLDSTGLFEQPGPALVAVSGGPDSRTLLELLVRVAERFGLTLLVGHVDHGIARDSGTWAAEVERVAERHGLPSASMRLSLGPGTSETAARHARYDALRALQRDHDARYLVTGHHADDQAETILFRVLRGSGVAGLAGMRARGPRGLRRPLLEFRRTELQAWLEETEPGHTVVVDPSNVETRHERVWIRTRLLPIIRERFPDVDHRLLATAHDATEHRSAWADVARLLPDLAFRVVEGGIEVARPTLRSYHKALSHVILRTVAREAGCVLGRRRAARVLAFAAGQSGRVMPLGDGWVAEIAFDRLRIHRPPDRLTARPPGVVSWGGAADGEASWDGWCITWGPAMAERVPREGWSTWVTLGEGVVRGARAGDRIRPLGGVGRREVRRLLMEGRVPRGERRTWPVLERDGDIVWVPGICRSTAALPRPGEPALRLDAHRH